MEYFWFYRISPFSVSITSWYIVLAESVSKLSEGNVGHKDNIEWRKNKNDKVFYVPENIPENITSKRIC